jgi:hypothetical protein
LPLALAGGATTGTAIWTTHELGPATHLAIIDSTGVGLSQEYSWEYVSGIWYSRGWRMRVRDENGDVLETVVQLSGGNVVQSAPPFSTQLFASCRRAAQSGLLAAARLILPTAAHAQAQYSGSDCWKYQRVGFNEVYSFPSQNSECANYSLNTAIGYAVPGIAVADAAVAGVGITALLSGTSKISAVWAEAIVASPVALGGALAGAAALLTGAAAVAYFDCTRHHQGLRAQCRALGGGTAPTASPVPGPMGEATGFSQSYVRGKVDAFWGITPKN